MPPRGNHDQPHAPCVDNLQHRYSPRLTAAFFGCHRAPPQGFTLRIYVSNKRRTGNGGCLCVRLGDVWDVGRERRCWRGGGVRGRERDERRRKGEAGSGAEPRKNFKNPFLPCFPAPWGVLVCVLGLLAPRSSPPCNFSPIGRLEAKVQKSAPKHGPQPHGRIFY